MCLSVQAPPRARSRQRGTEHRRIRGVLIFGFCSLLHVVNSALAVNSSDGCPLAAGLLPQRHDPIGPTRPASEPLPSKDNRQRHRRRTYAVCQDPFRSRSVTRSRTTSPNWLVCLATIFGLYPSRVFCGLLRPWISSATCAEEKSPAVQSNGSTGKFHPVSADQRFAFGAWFISLASRYSDAPCRCRSFPTIRALSVSA